MPRDDLPTVWAAEDRDLRNDVRSRKPGPVKSLPPQQQTVYLHREFNSCSGKTVLVKKLVLSDKHMKALAKKRKRSFGTDGTIKR